MQNGKDNRGFPYVRRTNCSKCGRFVGKDGYCDIGYDEYMGGYEIGYPICRKCLNEQQH
jgi:hypothetical protein